MAPAVASVAQNHLLGHHTTPTDATVRVLGRSRPDDGVVEYRVVQEHLRIAGRVHQRHLPHLEILTALGQNSGIRFARAILNAERSTEKLLINGTANLQQAASDDEYAFQTL